MRAIALGCVSIAYLLSVYTLPAFWNRVYTGIAARFDLSPEQMPLIPISLNLLAAVFGLPALFSLLRKPESTGRGPARLGFSIVCTVAVVLLVSGSLRWAASDYPQLAAGLSKVVEASNGGNEPSIVIDGGVYRDPELGLQVALPADWEVLSSNAIKRAHAAGRRAISSSGSASISNQLPEGVDQFLAIKKFPETHSGYNPSLAFVSYEKDAMRSSGCTSLDGLISPLARSGPPYRLLAGPSSSRVGDFDGMEVRLLGEFPGASVHQYVFGFETANHYVTVTAAFQGDEDYDVMTDVLHSVARTN